MIYDCFVDWNGELVEKMQPIGFDFFVVYKDDGAYRSRRKGLGL